MVIPSASLSVPILEWLSRSHDPDQAPLVLQPHGDELEVLRADGSEPSESEQIEFFSRLAIHAIEPHRRPTVRLHGLDEATTDGST